MPNIPSSLKHNLLPYCRLNVESPTDNRRLHPHKGGHLFIRKNHYCLSGFVMMGSFMLFCFEKNNCQEHPLRICFIKIGWCHDYASMTDTIVVTLYGSYSSMSIKQCKAPLSHSMTQRFYPN